MVKQHNTADKPTIAVYPYFVRSFADVNNHLFKAYWMLDIAGQFCLTSHRPAPESTMADRLSKMLHRSVSWTHSGFTITMQVLITQAEKDLLIRQEYERVTAKRK